MAIADYFNGTKHRPHAEQLRESLRMAVPSEIIQAQERAAAATTRRYARAAAISVTIRVSGIYLGTITLASLLRLAGRLKGSLENVRPELKVAVLAGVLFAFFHPTSRAWIIGKLKKLAPAAKFAIDAGMVLANLEQQNREEAKLHLAKVSVAADRTTNPARLKLDGAAGSQSIRK